MRYTAARWRPLPSMPAPPWRTRRRWRFPDTHIVHEGCGGMSGRPQHDWTAMHTLQPQSRLCSLSFVVASTPPSRYLMRRRHIGSLASLGACRGLVGPGRRPGRHSYIHMQTQYMHIARESIVNRRTRIRRRQPPRESHRRGEPLAIFLQTQSRGCLGRDSTEEQGNRSNGRAGREYREQRRFPPTSGPRESPLLPYGPKPPPRYPLLPLVVPTCSSGTRRLPGAVSAPTCKHSTFISNTAQRQCRHVNQPSPQSHLSAISAIGADNAWPWKVRAHRAQRARYAAIPDVSTGLAFRDLRSTSHATGHEPT